MGDVTFSDGSLRKKKTYNGSWEWQACVNRIEDGKRKQLRKMTGIPCEPKKPSESGSGRRKQATGKGARQAQAFLNEWRAELLAESESEDTPKQGMSVLDFMDWYWKTRSVEQVTLDGYAKLRKHLDHPTLRMGIDELEPVHVQTWIDTKLADSIGAPTIKKAFDQLNYACRWGVRMRQLKSNPCEPITPPKKAHRDPNPLDEESKTKLNEALDNLKEAGETQRCLADAAKLALLTGMRLGELCGLSWSDIDGGADGNLKTDGLIHVNNVVTAPKGGKAIKPYPKNKERRDIPMNPVIRDVLASRRELFVAMEGDDLTGCYVLARPSDAREFMSTGYLGHRWNTFIAITGIRGVQGLVPHFHDLRHTFATQALTNGVDVVTVASILGHKNTSTTLKYYARWMPNANASAMQKMGEVMG